jgi:hypothetical protein
MGTAPIDRIAVVKNGEVIFSRSYLTAPLTDHAWLLLGFQSSSEVFSPPRDNPRPYRVWEGTLQVTGARLLSVGTPGFDNLYLERAEREAERPDVIRFRLETRGRKDTMLIELEGASSATALRFHLEPTQEHGYAPPIVRPPAALSGEDFSLALADLEDGQLERELPVGPHTDGVTVETIDPEGALDMEFEYTDLLETAPGDYYYVRVTQLDGAQAWSSPFWIGEKPAATSAARP